MHLKGTFTKNAFKTMQSGGMEEKNAGFFKNNIQKNLFFLNGTFH